MSPDVPFTLLSDEPAVFGEDSLGFDAVAAELGALVLASQARTPLALGIQASWGAGKSTLMHRLEERLRNEPGVRTVWFDAWLAERADVLGGMIKAALEQLDPNVLRRLLKRSELQAGLRIGLLLLAGWLRVGDLVNEIWERAAVDARTRKAIRGALEEVMRQWIAETPPNTTHLVVVFVDDLDRCAPETVFAVFEVVRLYLDLPGFVFVIGYDESVISEAVLRHKRYSKSVKSRDYLEKIVQIVHRIPEPDPASVKAFLDTCTAASGTSELLDEASRTLIIEGNRRNPRRLKRFINAFVLEHRINPEAAQLSPKVLINSLILETYFPDFTRLFSERGARNPIDEFFDYLAVRGQLIGGDGSTRDAELVRRVFREHGVAPTETPELADLERNLPEDWPGLARNEHFVSVLRDLRKEAASEDVTSRLERAAKTAEEVDEAAAEVAAPVGVGGPLDGLRLLWIDDAISSEPNMNLVRKIEREGAAVATASSGAQARELLASGAFDLVISDASRGADPDAGFRDMGSFRSEGLFDGPVVFYVGRVTAHRRERAAALGAKVTTNAGELIRELYALAARTRMKSAAVPA
jgi:CheY-like chemotaxis protein